MAKNMGREFATMDEDERRRFAMEAEESTDSAPAELDFENPRAEQNEDTRDREGAAVLPDHEENPGPEAA